MRRECYNCTTIGWRNKVLQIGDIRTQNLITCRIPMARNRLIVYKYVTNCTTKCLEVKGVFLSSLF